METDYPASEGRTTAPLTVAQRTTAIVDEFSSLTLTTPELLCDRHPADDVAFRFVDAEYAVTDLSFGELADRSKRIATVLNEHGVGQGDRVATLMGKSAHLPAIILAIWRLGAVYVPLFTAFASDSVLDRLDRAEAKIVITDELQNDKVAGAQASHMTAEEIAAEAADASAWSSSAPTGGDVPLVHMFTSGTTGKPKAVVHPRSYIAGWLGYLEFGLGVTPDSVFWCAADPGWAYGLYTALVAPLATGVTSIMTTAQFAPQETWDVLEELGVTNFAAAPTALRAMKNAKNHRPLPALTQLSTAGEPLTPDVLEWTQKLGIAAHDHFGQTELGMIAGFAHTPEIAEAVRPQSMGRQFPGWQVLVLDMVADTPAAAGTPGRLAVDTSASPFLSFTGYGVDRDIRADRFSADGQYYLTGDIAEMSEDGHLKFSSRDDDVILMSGYRIGPFEIESTILKHPAVSEAAVVAAPDDDRGEIVCAFVVLNDDVQPTDDLSVELQTWVKTNYGAHAYPRRIEFVDTLPKTPSGKVQRSVLRSTAKERQ